MLQFSRLLKNNDSHLLGQLCRSHELIRMSADEIHMNSIHVTSARMQTFQFHQPTTSLQEVHFALYLVYTVSHKSTVRRNSTPAVLTPRINPCSPQWKELQSPLITHPEGLGDSIPFRSHRVHYDSGDLGEEEAIGLITLPSKMSHCCPPTSGSPKMAPHNWTSSPQFGRLGVTAGACEASRTSELAQSRPQH